MGGRGSGFGGGGGGLSSILGRKGAPRTIDEAKARSNPHYREGKVWQLNCQRCVWAYEMERRGYDVEAKPRILDGTDRLPYSHGPDRMGGGWLDVGENLTLRDITDTVAHPRVDSTIRTINQYMAGEGDGTRCIIRVTWKGNSGGHVFIAEQENGMTRYLDPQTGHNVIPEEYFKEATLKYTQYVRIDNAKINKDMIDKCVQRRR